MLVGLILISAVVGAVRGLLREVLSILSVIASAVLAIFFLPVLLGPLADRIGTAAYPVAFLVLFVGAMIAFAFLGRFLSGILKLARLRAADRLLGVVFGLARAGVVVAIILTMAVLLLPPRHPQLRTSRLLPIASPAVSWIGDRLPGRIGSEFQRRWSVIRHEVRGQRLVHWAQPVSCPGPGPAALSPRDSEVAV